MKTARDIGLSKVPEVTIFFWIIKILTTAMGESTSDYLVYVMNPAVAVSLGGLALVIALTLQFKAKRYVPWRYWLAVLMVAVFGTMAADVVHIALGIPYIVSTVSFTLSLVVVFALWYAYEKSLSIHSIYIARREAFYWATVMATFALGTAAGDMTAVTLGWGYLYSGVIFAILIGLVALSHYVTKGILTIEHRHMSRNAVIAFWSAYVLTRPLGASFADWMGKLPTLGGLGWGDGTVSLGLFVLIACLVGYLTVMHTDAEKHSL